MRTTTTTVHGRHIHPSPQPVARPLPPQRVALLDRFALHVGLALIRWGRRSHSSLTHEHGAHRVEQALAIRSRELAWERSARLTLPPR
ncbi:hypothetical protein QMG83_13030 [Salinibacterium sp. G-O1]|uniref:hypothetical protein n=1 Tax=Salinibacterium sp. G-O1 TaxID=3046208 RepID=UPI0024BBD523|nr:hypothetical protein [Salinibacterium sp. G-O1]MDJ0336149.1 hypothetical protein [Salinibacterium sp. G-O1]